MKKRIITMLLALVMVASLIGGAIPALAAEGAITLRLHYFREDGDYENWEMWFWDNAAVPSTNLEPPYQFEEIDGEMICEVKLNTGTMEIGYIVRYGDWIKKDVDEDQFINITGVLSGTVDVYVKSGIKGHEIVLGPDCLIGVVVTSASYKEKSSDGNPQVIVKMSSKVEKYEVTTDTFKIFNNDGAVAITAVKNVNSYYYLTLAEPLNIQRGYNVSFEDNDFAITMPDFYSSPEFEAEYTYTGNDLGATYTPEKTNLRVWAPTAIGVNVNLYTSGDITAEELPVRSEPMTKDVNGTWICELTGDMNGTYYTYEVTTDTSVLEACDPYARTTGVNGKRAMIIDLDATNPEGWADDKNPNADLRPTDVVIYELHVRDLTSNAASGCPADKVGKFLGVIEKGTVNSEGKPTGLDYITDLGVTHVHLLPVYDYGSVQEDKLDEKEQFNWGYDPMNYNVPEGSYSSDPYNGEVRVKEMKQMIKGMHDAGLSVIMDVVYNHVYQTNSFCFNMIVPGYFSRPGANGSGCGNDTASERNMVSKYIVDSVNYWADEYHIDGFRFDLVGLIDTNTINEIVKTVHEKNPDVIFYGEGWSMNTKMTKTGYALTTQQNASKVKDFAFFSDTVRNLVKGNTYGGVSAGWISGGNASAGDLNACFKGMPSWCPTPSQSINYISCHDNNTLYDHITMVAKSASEAERIAMNKLGAAFVLTSQGIPFFQAGEEILRSKPVDGGYHENSYNQPDSVNSIKWDDLNKAEYMDVHDYYKGLIAFRKEHPALRLATAAEVDANVQPLTGLPAGVVAYNISGNVEGESAESIFAAFNAGKTPATINLPEGDWHICVNGEDAGIVSLGVASGSVTVNSQSALVLVKGDVVTVDNDNVKKPATSFNPILLLPIIAAVVVAAAVVVVILLKKKK